MREMLFFPFDFEQATHYLEIEVPYSEDELPKD